MNELQIHQFPCRTDNYGVLVHDPATKLCATIDTPDGDEILRELDNKGWQLTHIFNTHHHYDHIPGNLMLKERTGCTIVGSKRDAHQIPGIDTQMVEGEIYQFGTHRITLLETPGHTLGSVCYYIEPGKILFAGDTLFSMGCGRMFEGTAAMMWQSMVKIRALHDDTQLYCGHEYTLSNAEFALEVEPDNKALQQRVDEVKKLRRAHLPTLPISLGTEKATNPFLRADCSSLQQFFGMQGEAPDEVFAAVRTLKNDF